MKVLVIAPVQSSFNSTLHYRYTDIGEVAGYLLKELDFIQVRFLDILVSRLEYQCVKLALSWAEAVIFYTDVANAPLTQRLATMIKQVDLKLPIAVYGKGVLRIQQYFTRFPFDAIHCSGDPEAALESWIKYLKYGNVPKGLKLSENKFSSTDGVFLEPKKWGLPALELLPLNAYRELSETKNTPFELSVFPGKGCPYKCEYCDAPNYEGNTYRWRDPDFLIEWIIEAINKYNFDSVQMHSTNFCADPEWLSSFCDTYRKFKCNFKWTCCTRVHTLSLEKLANIKNAGCFRVGIGVENLNQNTSVGGKTSLKSLEKISKWITDLNMDCKAYIMAGYPGQSEQDLVHTYRTCKNLKFIPRVSAYTPFEKLTDLSVEKLEELNLALYDRKSFISEDNVFPSTSMRLLLRLDDNDKWIEKRYQQLKRR